MSLHHHVIPEPGESALFHLETHWRLATPMSVVWHEFSNPATWPTWWPGIAVTYASPAQARLTVSSPLGTGLAVHMRLQSSDPPRAAEVAVTGDLRGTGHWRARTDNGPAPGTRVDFVWCVVTRKPLLRVLRPLAATAHNRVMQAGQSGLRSHLERLLGGLG